MRRRGGLAQTWTDGAEEWSYQLGAAARSGVTATLLAQAGVLAGTPSFHGSGGPLMSVPWCVAVAIVRRGLPLDGLSARGPRECAGLADRVEVERDAGLAPLDARIEIETAQGDRLVSRCPGNAASYSWRWDEIVSWARSLGGEVGDPYLRAIERVVEAVEELEHAPSVGRLAAATVIEPRSLDPGLPRRP